MARYYCTVNPVHRCVATPCALLASASRGGGGGADAGWLEQQRTRATLRERRRERAAAACGNGGGGAAAAAAGAAAAPGPDAITAVFRLRCKVPGDVREGPGSRHALLGRLTSQQTIEVVQTVPEPQSPLGRVWYRFHVDDGWHQPFWAWTASCKKNGEPKFIPK